jgi:hypothetical protein
MPSRPATLLTWMQLFRLPNVFTAVADVLLGWLVVQRSFERPELMLWLVAASCLLYTSGMVLNDVYDRQIDAEERPERPIPSGRIDARLAHRVGLAMLAGGVLAACAAGAIGTSHSGGQSWLWRPVAVALALAALVLLYNRSLKHTPLGPAVMGSCRLLNVLLGMSMAAAWLPMHFVLAGGVGVYVAGISWMARGEAGLSSRPHLVGGTVVMLAGLALVAWYPQWLPAGGQWTFRIESSGWQMLWAVLGLLVGYRCLAAIFTPHPALVQRAVKHAILSLIVIDAAATLPAAGPMAIVIALLLLPTMVLGQWVYST